MDVEKELVGEIFEEGALIVLLLINIHDPVIWASQLVGKCILQDVVLTLQDKAAVPRCGRVSPSW